MTRLELEVERLTGALVDAIVEAVLAAPVGTMARGLPPPASRPPRAAGRPNTRPRRPPVAPAPVVLEEPAPRAPRRRPRPSRVVPVGLFGGAPGLGVSALREREEEE